MKKAIPWPRPTPAVTEQTYLDRLDKHLVQRLPASQIQEVLSDYREQFQAGRERGRSDAELIKAMGSPEEAALGLLEETPPSGLLRQYLPLGALLALCLVFFRLFIVNPYPGFTFSASLCGCLFLPMLAGTLFALLRGGARLELEKQFPPERTASRKVMFGVPLAVAVVFKVGHQVWIAATLRAPAEMTNALPISPGELNQLLCFGLAGLMALLSLWWLSRCVTCSIQYFPGTIHALGLAVAWLTTLVPFLSMDVADAPTPRSFLPEVMLYFLPYLAGLVTALLFQRWLDTQLPSCFRQPDGRRQDYLDKLGKCLLRWYPAAQVREILSDYQEQFEAGLERGKTEAALAEELGRPETVARDLLAADSPLPRRAAWKRNVLWGIVLIPAVWVLVGMFLRFEYGNQWLLGPDLAPLFLILGAIAMFSLLRGMNRAEVESLFPPVHGKPPLWAFLLPLVDMFLTAVGFWYLLTFDSWYVNGDVTRTAIIAVSFIELSVLLLDVLLVWTLSRSATRSIRYFPAAVLAAGAAMGCLKTGQTAQHINLDAGIPMGTGEFAQYLLAAIFPYLMAVVLATGFWLVICVCARRAREC